MRQYDVSSQTKERDLPRKTESKLGHHFIRFPILVQTRRNVEQANDSRHRNKELLKGHETARADPATRTVDYHEALHNGIKVMALCTRDKPLRIEAHRVWEYRWIVDNFPESGCSSSGRMNGSTLAYQRFPMTIDLAGMSYPLYSSSWTVTCGIA